MTNDELNYLINELSVLYASKGWEIMQNHLQECYNSTSDSLDSIDSEKNIVKYNEYDMIRHDKFIYKGMKELIPTLINTYQNQKTPNGDFEQV